AVMVEFERRSQDFAGAAPGVGGGLFAVAARQLGFWVERVDVRRAPVHEEENHPLRFRRMVAMPHREWIVRRRQRRRRRLREDICQAERAETGADALEHLAAGEGQRRSQSGHIRSPRLFGTRWLDTASSFW